MAVHIGRRKFPRRRQRRRRPWPAKAWSQGAAKERQRIGCLWIPNQGGQVVCRLFSGWYAGLRLCRWPGLRLCAPLCRGISGPASRACAGDYCSQTRRNSRCRRQCGIAARGATKATPIVCAALADAVNLGLIASEARPGGNVTGIEPYVAGLPAKANAGRPRDRARSAAIGLLTSLHDPKAPPQRQELRDAAKAFELTIAEADANSPGEIEPAMQALTSSSVDVVIVLQTGLFLGAGQQIAQLAAAKRLPTVYGYREHVLAGGLISYGVDLRWCYHRAAYFVDKILHGTPPGELPVEFPTKMMLSINLKTAKALGITIPPMMLPSPTK